MLACSRLSVVGDERKQAGEKMREDWAEERGESL